MKWRPVKEQIAGVTGNKVQADKIKFLPIYIGADGEEFLNEATLYAAMRKYCAFMPVPIFVDVLKEETEEEKASAKKAENTVHVSPEEAAKLTTEGAMDLLQEQQDTVRITFPWT